jgi:hypothetical protein
VEGQVPHANGGGLFCRGQEAQRGADGAAMRAAGFAVEGLGSRQKDKLEPNSW